MKKVLSAVLALAMVFSLSCTAFAVEEVPYEPVATEETISCRSRACLFRSPLWVPVPERLPAKHTTFLVKMLYLLSTPAHGVPLLRM